MKYCQSIWILAASTFLCSAADVSATPEVAQRAVLAQFAKLSIGNELQSTEGKRIRHGEAISWAFPGAGSVVFDKVIQVAPDQSVARLPASDAGPDRYLFLARVGGEWKIVAGRSLALTGLLAMLKSEFEKLPNRSIQQEATLRNARLTLSSDQYLSEWFNSHHDELDDLRKAFVKSATTSWRNDMPGLEGGATSSKLTELGLLSVFRNEAGHIQVTIGGMVDNEVGFMFVEADAKPPAISSSRYIWVEPLSGGWYYYKTT
ncbi:MAG: hypothetical protein ABIU10_08490 [Sphingomicrobium sp.]